MVSLFSVGATKRNARLLLNIFRNRPLPLFFPLRKEIFWGRGKRKFHFSFPPFYEGWFYKTLLRIDEADDMC